VALSETKRLIVLLINADHRNQTSETKPMKPNQ
jgi:hypothetical protein